MGDAQSNVIDTLVEFLYLATHPPREGDTKGSLERAQEAMREARWKPAEPDKGDDLTPEEVERTVKAILVGLGRDKWRQIINDLGRDT